MLKKVRKSSRNELWKVGRDKIQVINKMQY